MTEDAKTYDNSNTGALFTNDRKTHDGHPTLTGSCIITEPGEYWIDAWANMIKSGKRQGQKMLKLKFKRKDAPQDAAPASGQLNVEDLPF